jgi:carboxymethylenebutenolidase
LKTRAVEDALRAAGKSYTQVTFSDAGHGFFCDERPSYEPNAARQSWALTLAFFESYLRA